MRSGGGRVSCEARGGLCVWRWAVTTGGRADVMGRLSEHEEKRRDTKRQNHGIYTTFLTHLPTAAL